MCHASSGLSPGECWDALQIANELIVEMNLNPEDVFLGQGEEEHVSC